MKLDTLAPLVDIQPVFSALVELRDQRDLFDRATKAFLVSKLKEAVQSMRDTADFIENELKSLKID